MSIASFFKIAGLIIESGMTLGDLQSLVILDPNDR